MARTNGAAAVAAATETIKEHFVPALEMCEENVRQARLAFVKGKEAAEDLAAAARLEARRHPFRAAAVVAGVGALAGGLIGFAVGRRRH
jgi:ElaB/YqjD/DUF883 family membrane-anchored ribosome-binding protein